jgi:hypothetical protein
MVVKWVWNIFINSFQTHFFILKESQELFNAFFLDLLSILVNSEEILFNLS